MRVFKNASVLHTRRMGQNFQSQFALIKSPTAFQAVVIVTCAIDGMRFTDGHKQKHKSTVEVMAFWVSYMQGSQGSTWRLEY